MRETLRARRQHYLAAFYRKQHQIISNDRNSAVIIELGHWPQNGAIHTNTYVLHTWDNVLSVVTHPSLSLTPTLLSYAVVS